MGYIIEYWDKEIREAYVVEHPKAKPLPWVIKKDGLPAPIYDCFQSKSKALHQLIIYQIQDRFDQWVKSVEDIYGFSGETDIVVDAVAEYILTWSERKSAPRKKVKSDSADV